MRDNGGNGDGSIEELRQVFRDRPELVFRHFEDCNVSFMSCQAGRMRCIEIETTRGWMFDEAFELLAFAETSNGLIDKLTLLDGQ